MDRCSISIIGCWEKYSLLLQLPSPTQSKYNHIQTHNPLLSKSVPKFESYTSFVENGCAQLVMFNKQLDWLCPISSLTRYLLHIWTRPGVGCAVRVEMIWADNVDYMLDHGCNCPCKGDMVEVDFFNITLCGQHQGKLYLVLYIEKQRNSMFFQN